MAVKKILQSGDGQQIHPLTRTNAVYTEDNIQLDEYLGAMVEYTQAVEESIPTKINEALVGVGFSLPAGVIVPFAGINIPDGYLFCRGQQLNKTEYPDLFNAIGYTYGADESNADIFFLPNLSGRSIFGQSTQVDSDGNVDSNFGTLGGYGGQRNITLLQDNMPKHFHEVDLEHYHTAGMTSAGSHYHSGTTGSSYAGSSNYFLTSPSAWEKDGGGNVEGSGDNYPKQDNGAAVNSTTTSHYHSFTTSTAGSHYHEIDIDNYDGVHLTSNVGEGLPFNSLNPYLVMNFIIKY